MASPFQQQSLYRKLTYVILVVALFSLSLWHRKGVINARAEELRLRHVDQGEVSVTDTTARLMLSGLRGVAVTALWSSIIERQKRHEWSEMEVLVRSLTKLQPHYITPWLYQSWNLAFNVSVECDRSRDKYHYISRGIELLAEGERKNRGNEHPSRPELRSPPSPEMRYYIGFTYQLKIGQGDEKRTLRCLLDLSCIDPLKRNPDKMRLDADDKEEREKAQAAFRTFCEENPRLVRRLREQLDYKSPRDIIGFLSDNREVPTRFDPPKSQPATESILKRDIEQFPILPPCKKRGDWPDPEQVSFGGVDVDVFQILRAWSDYAQEPLPPETGKVAIEPVAVPGRHRMPKMALYIFRTSPARAQAYYAEELEKEGWFAGEGWAIKWSDELAGDAPDQTLIVGKNRFDARQAWQKAHDMYVDYAKRNALTLEERDRLAHIAAREGPQSAAAAGVRWIDGYHSMTNYLNFLDQTDAESRAETVAARHKLYLANRLRLEGDIRALAAYEEAMEDWTDVMVRFWKFSRQQDIQEDTYEMELDYLVLLMKQKRAQIDLIVKAVSNVAVPPNLEGALLAVAEYGSWPKEEDKGGYLPADYKGNKLITVPVRAATRGPLDRTFVYAGTRVQKERLERLLLGMAQFGMWPQTARLDHLLLARESPARPAFEASTVGLLASPLGDGPFRAASALVPVRPQMALWNNPLWEKHKRLLLMTRTWHEVPPGPDWLPLIDPLIAQSVRDRQRWTPPPPSQGPANKPQAPQ